MRKDPVFKICISGLLLALVIIFTRFLSIQNIPAIPFVRISLGPALIIFGSIVLGPLYGGIIGGASDILGILLVPNTLGYGINPWFTLIYTLLGILPWCFFKLLDKVKNEKKSFVIFCATLLVFWIFVLVFALTNDVIAGKTFEIWQKLLVIIISFVLCILTLIAVIFIGRHFKKNSDVSVMNVAFTSLLSEILLMLIAGSIAKSVFFQIDFLTMLFLQSIVFFIDVPLNTLVVSYLIKLTNNVFLKRSRKTQ